MPSDFFSPNVDPQSTPEISSDLAELIRQSVETQRQRLLDTTRRNKLINFKPSASSMSIVDELPDQICERLLSGERFTFQPAPESEEGILLPKSIDLTLPSQPLSTSVRLPHHTDDLLQTPHPQKKTEAALDNIRRYINSEIQETGGSSLYLALGFLEWYAKEDSSVSSLAPLYLIPVSLSRRLDKRRNLYIFDLEYSGDEVQRNESLAELLRSQFNIELPQLPDDMMPEAYFEKVSDATVGQVTWSIRREAYLSSFAFSKLWMYRDLDSEKWKDFGGLTRSSVLNALLGGQERTEDRESSEGYDIDGTPEYRRMLLPLNADSSQHEAIIDAAKGESFVLIGPPGTGKSQTITNLIAWAIGSGKSVLFVAEKLAALEVVYRNLSKVDLHHFCLQIHSDKTNTAKALEQIESRFQFVNHSIDQERHLDKIDAQREKIEEYIKAITKKVGPRGELLADVFWRVAELRGFGAEPDKQLAHLIDSDERQLDEITSYFGSLKRAFREIGPEGRRRWQWFDARELRESDTPAVMRIIRKIAEACCRMNDAVSVLTLDEEGRRWPNVMEVASVRDKDFQSLLPPADFSPHLVQSLRNGLDPQQVLAWAARFERLQVVKNGNPGLWKLVGDYTSLEHADTVSKLLAPDAPLRQLDSQTLGQLRRTRGLLESAKDNIEEASSIAFRLQELNLGGAETLDQLNTLRDKYAMFSGAKSPRSEHLTNAHFGITIQRTFSSAQERHRYLSEQVAPIAETIKLNVAAKSDKLSHYVDVLGKHGSSSLRLLNSEYRQVRADVRNLLMPGVKLKPVDLAGKLQAVIQYALDSHLFANDASLKQDLGPIFRGSSTNWIKLQDTLRWAEQAMEHGIRYVDVQKLFVYMEEAEDLPSLSKLDSCLKQLREVLDDDTVVKVVDWDASLWRVPLTDISARISEAIAQLEQLDEHLIGLPTLAVDTVDDARQQCSLLIMTANDYQTIDSDPTIGSQIGDIFDAEDTPIAPLRATEDWYSTILRSGLPPHIVSWLLVDEHATRICKLSKSLVLAVAGYDEILTQIEKLREFGVIKQDDLLGKSSEDQGTAELATRLQQLASSESELVQWASVCRLYSRASSMNIESTVERIQIEDLDPQIASQVCELSIYDAIASRELEADPVLQQFDRRDIENARDLFAKLDEDSLQLNAETIATHARNRKPFSGQRTGRPGDLTELGLIEHEMGKSRRHVKLRQLFSRAGHSVQQLMPCIMMSPLTVSKHLPAGEMDFDLLVMDEASQIKTEDALGALLRTKQVVIVGDPKQLPPSTFWDSHGEQEIDEEQATLADNSESVLEAAERAFSQSRMLKWHYRSRHPSLITFSNEQFYEDQLVVFPSPNNGDGKLGVSLFHVKDGVFQGGTNEIEARFVAERVIEHALLHDGRSLGVAAFNRAQADLIQSLLDSYKLERSDARDALEAIESHVDPLFVKNLENVQGDERDVMIISYTYGPLEPGGTPPQRFGPINKQDGWRRLNVLVTRAKERVEVCSSLTPEQILGGEGKRGVNAMRDYLRFASRNGRISEAGEITGKGFDSPFEEAVGSVIRKLGFDFDTQIGVAGYRIDLGVRVPGAGPGNYLLGIECDGATYHSSRVARDRDRLREAVIRDRGWRLHRIWSTDWFLNQKTEIKRLADAIQSTIIELGIDS
tara:strand:- start:411 stop:5390 length:4980 start_codon:yes stop_codon:yes gene_type:complete